VFSNIFISTHVNFNGFRANRNGEVELDINVLGDLTGLYILPKGLSTLFYVQEKF